MIWFTRRTHSQTRLSDKFKLVRHAHLENFNAHFIRINNKNLLERKKTDLDDYLLEEI